MGKNLELSWKTLRTPRKVFKFSEFPHLMSKDSKVDPITLQIQDAQLQIQDAQVQGTGLNVRDFCSNLVSHRPWVGSIR